MLRMFFDNQYTKMLRMFSDLYLDEDIVIGSIIPFLQDIYILVTEDGSLAG